MSQAHWSGLAGSRYVCGECLPCCLRELPGKYLCSLSWLLTNQKTCYVHSRKGQMPIEMDFVTFVSKVKLGRLSADNIRRQKPSCWYDFEGCSTKSSFGNCWSSAFRYVALCCLDFLLVFKPSAILGGSLLTQDVIRTWSINLLYWWFSFEHAVRFKNPNGCKP